MQSDFENFLNTRGMQISAVGMKDRGLYTDDALTALSMLRGSTKVVLGGDVYYEKQGKFELAYANWSASKRENESAVEYKERSIATAEMYIKKFPDRLDKNSVFVLTICDIDDLNRIFLARKSK